MVSQAQFEQMMEQLVEVARVTSSLDRRLAVLERTDQVAASTLTTGDGETVGYSDVAEQAVDITPDVAVLNERIASAEDAVAAAGRLADEAATLGAAAGEDGRAAAAEAAEAADDALAAAEVARQNAATAQQRADDASAAAAGASDTAGQARQDAADAQTAAAAAHDLATQASADADDAVQRAQDASAAASDANTSAGDAVSKAQQAKDAAAAAVQSASDANTAASTAGSKAQQAYDQATAAAGAASSAQSSADGALSVANGKGKTIVQVSAPTGGNATAQNLWVDISVDSATGKPRNRLNQWNPSTSKWEPLPDFAVAVAQTTADSAATAASTADGKAVAAKTAADNAQTKANQASTDAASAAGIANGKADVLIQSTTPTAAFQKATTLWIDTTSGANAPKRWGGSTWNIVTDKAATDAAAAAANAQTAATTAKTAADTAQSRADAAYAAAGTAQTTADGKGKTIVQVSAPTGANATAANLWIDISTDSSGNQKNQLNRWNPSTSKWESVSDLIAQNAAATAAAAQSAAATAKSAADTAQGRADSAFSAASDAATAATKAQSTADGMVSWSALSPTTSDVRPNQATWFRIVNGQTTEQWQSTGGGQWIKRAIDNNLLAANIDAGKLTAGVIASARIGAQTITASQLAVADFTDRVPDPYFTTPYSIASLAGSTLAKATDTGIPAGAPAATVAKLGKMYDGFVGEWFPVQPGEQFYVEVQAVNTTSSPTSIRIGLWVANTPQYGGNSFGYPDIGMPSSSASTWKKLSGSVTVPAMGGGSPGTGTTYPPQWARVRISTENGDGWIVTGYHVRRKNGGELVVDGSVTANSLAAGSVTTAKVAAGAITANELAAAAVTAGKIAAGTIVANDIATGTITGDRLTAGTIGAGQIAAGAVTTVKLAAGAVTANEIASGTITSDRIAAGTIQGDRIATDSLTATQIAAGAIGTGELAAGAVTAAKITAGSITGDRLAAGTITGDRIVAGTITAGDLAIGDFTNLIDDPEFAAGGWTRRSGATTASNIVTTTGLPGASWKLDGVGTEVSVWTPGFAMVDPSSPYFVSFRAQNQLTGTSPIAYFRLYWYTEAGTYITYNEIQVPTTGAWVDYSGTFTAPATARRAVPVFIHGNNNTGGSWWFGRPRLRRMNGGELIVDGSISTNKIIAAAITGAKIAADTITAANIAAGAVQADEIAANAITSDKIAANAITAAHISAGAIQTDDLAANAVTAAKIAAATITAAQIASGTISTDNLAAGAVTAAKIAAATITGDRIAASSITGDHIVANTITAADIAAATITGAEIAAASITAGNLAADSVTAAKIGADAVLARNIKAGEVVAGKLAAASVVAENIVAATITGDKLAANSVTAREILAGSITASLLSANAIDGKTITGATVQTAASGKRAVLGGSLIRFYDDNNQQSGQVEGIANGAGGGVLRVSPDGGASAASYFGTYPLPTAGSATFRSPVMYADKYARSDDTDWANATLKNGYTNRSGNPAQYKRVNGIVYLRGQLYNANPGTAAFTLPVGFRPDTQDITMHGGVTPWSHYTQVSAAGDVNITSSVTRTSSTGYILDGISFPV